MKSLGLEDVNISSVDGVRTIWVDADRPFTGALIFRVGMYDEHLRNRGITHLVEHLALSPLRETELTYNGTVEAHQTTLWAGGEPGGVAGFLSDACKHLHNLPVDRLDVERGVLEQEAAQRPRNYASELLFAYFGPRGPGMGNHYEYGITWLGAEELAEWSNRYFTKANAILVFTGPPPADLKLDLPSGEVRPLVAPDRSHWPAPQEPTLLQKQKLGVTWGALTRRSSDEYKPEFGISMPILAKRLDDRLRHDLGRVYSAADSRWRLDRELFFVMLGLDCAEEHSREVSMEFISVLDRYAEEGPTREEVDRQIRLYESAQADHPDAFLRSMAFGEAERILCDWGPPVEPSTALDITRGMALDAIRDRFAEGYRQSFYVADPKPLTLPMPADRFADSPGPGVTFRRSMSRAFDKESVVKKVTIGPGGISYTAIDREATMNDSRMVLIYVPVDEIELVAFDQDLMAVESTHGASWFDTSHFARGSDMERVCREQLPEDKVLPKR